MSQVDASASLPVAAAASRVVGRPQDLDGRSIPLPRSAVRSSCAAGVSGTHQTEVVLTMDPRGAVAA